ncbi:MAG: homoserine dehydrogenase [Lentisphaerae bacterium RIFOXYA12_FULL_60_10]|nr:MAG: homoserine dehydrogenase [Lentisphaerae bacterium RIFOXYA12_FULL_60_10]
MKTIGVGLMGFGTVGAGVVRTLAEHAGLLESRLGARVVLRRIADLDLDTDRGVVVDRSLMTTDAKALIEDPAVDIVVELIGGTGIARDLVTRALEQGKPVVTANKALLAHHGRDLFDLAARKKVDLYFGASVGGGIPIIRALREGLVANRIQGIRGILNGTCNYILTRMEQEGATFKAALGAAQKAGYAEADPGLDIDGHDTAHKAVILASLAFGFMMPLEAVHVEGIRGLSDADIAYARDLGYRIKLLAVIKGDETGVEVRVHPALVPLGNVLSSVNGVFNAVMVQSDPAGNTLYYGRGAGRDPTASTVAGDIADVARNLVAGSPCRVPALSLVQSAPKPRPMADIETRYYLRMLLLDKPGVFARIASILGGQGISIASVLQKEGGEGRHVPVVIMTHQAREGRLNAALDDIVASDVISGRPVRIRVEE